MTSLPWLEPIDIHQIDSQDRKIFDLCEASSFRILNERTRGDFEGILKRFPRRFNENPSVMDHTLCSTDLLSEIYSFTASPFASLSHHCCISSKLCKILLEEIKINKYVWKKSFQ